MRFEAEPGALVLPESEPLGRLVDKRSRASLWALRAIYLRLLLRIEAATFEVLSRR